MDLHANEFEFQELPGFLLPDLPALASCIAALSSAPKGQKVIGQET